MNTPAPTGLHTARLLVACYLGLSVLTLVAAVLLRDTTAVTGAVWVRGGIIAVVALVTMLVAQRAVQGSHGAFRRLRILTAVQVVAIAVIVAIPGLLPAWMRIEQVLCGLLLLGVVVLINGRRVRA